MPLEQLRVKCLAQGHIGVSVDSNLVSYPLRHHHPYIHMTYDFRSCGLV